MGFGVFHELLEILRRKVRFHQQHHRGRDGADDRRKILGGIVGQVFQHRDVAGLRRVGSHQQGVTVRRAARDFLRAETAERAAAVLDHDRLPQLILQALADQARDLIGTGAGGKRHDDLDLPRRIVVDDLGRRRRNSRQEPDRRERGIAASSCFLQPLSAKSLRGFLSRFIRTISYDSTYRGRE